ncbi:MAG: SDR family NAD(P)-dependent oxidoreductase [Paludibacteraceae bacterium]
MSKFALITGGTKGIGKAVALSLSKSGYNLILTYGNDDLSASETQKELSEKYKNIVFVLRADVTSEQSIEQVTAFLEEKNIRLYAVIFNAGITSRTPFEKINPTEWEHVFYANVHFPVYLLQRILPKIQEGGNVLFTGSLMGVYPHSVSLAYGVTKSAVHALVQNLVKFLAPYKIRVNGIAPGFVDTDWQKTKPAEIRKSIENKIAVARFCNPDELAEVYRLIVENNYLNGEIITVSGGYSYK